MTFSDVTDSAGVIVSGADVATQLERYDERCFTAASADVATAASALSSIWSLFGALHAPDLARLKTALTAEYKPLDNYNMTETGMDKRTVDRDYTREVTGLTNDTGNTSTDSTNTRTDNLTETVTRTGTVKTDGMTTSKTTDGTTIKGTSNETVKDNGTTSNINKVNAYDVADLVNHDSQAGTSSNDRTTTGNTSETHSGDVNVGATISNTVTNGTTDTTTNAGTVKSEGGETFSRDMTSETIENVIDQDTTTDNAEHTLTRSGNIGVTTSQQMLESEINLRVKNQLVYYVVELFVSQYLTW